MAPRFRFSARLKRRVLFATPLVALSTCVTTNNQEPLPTPVKTDTKAHVTPVPGSNADKLPKARNLGDVFMRNADKTCWEGGFVRPGQPKVAPVQVQCVSGAERRVLVGGGEEGCMIDFQVECPPNATCNPPPPQPVVCPPGGVDGNSSNTSVPKPPVLPQPASSSRVAKRPDGTCWEVVRVNCPKPKPGEARMTCNPPPPRQVECPAPTLPPPRDPSRVFTRNDGTCWESPKFNCPTTPKGQLRPTCNPPPPRQVQCLPKRTVNPPPPKRRLK